MSSFQFAEEDVQVEEVQLLVVFTETGQASRLLRKEDMKDNSLYDKNAAQVGSYIYKELGIKKEMMGDMCVYSPLAVMASGSDAGRKDDGSRGSGQQNKDSSMMSVRGATIEEVKALISGHNKHRGNVLTNGETAIIQTKPIAMYKGSDRRTTPSDERSFLVEVGMVGEENNYHSLFSHGLITDDIQGVVFTGRFTPQGGYDVGNYTPCLRALAQEALAPYFSGQRVEVMRVTQAHPFGVAAVRQATNAVLITCRAPEGQQLFALPSNMLTPTGMYDHPSHHAKAGQVPQMEATRMAWFLNGNHSADGSFMVVRGDLTLSTC